MNRTSRCLSLIVLTSTLGFMVAVVSCTGPERQAAVNIGTGIAERRGFITEQDAADIQDLATLIPDTTSSK